MFLFVHGPIGEFNENVQRVLGGVRTDRLNCFSVLGVLCPSIHGLQVGNVGQLGRNDRSLALTGVFFPRNLHRIVVLLVTFNGRLSAKRFCARVRFMRRPFLARALKRDPIRERARLYFSVFWLFFGVRVPVDYLPGTVRDGPYYGTAFTLRGLRCGPR